MDKTLLNLKSQLESLSILKLYKLCNIYGVKKTRNKENLINEIVNKMYILMH